MIDKKTREKIYDKYGGHCAYCGIKLTKDNFQVDHKVPKIVFERAGQNPDEFSNLMPSCKVCNHYKRALDLEIFRKKWLGGLHLRIKRIPKKPRTERGWKKKKYMEQILERYGITEDKPFRGIFYFEEWQVKKGE